MSKIPPASDFFTAIIHDPRVSPMHISLYMALLHWSEVQGGGNPVYGFSRDIMPLAKFSSVATYHRVIRELDEFGYIKYTPSHNAFLGSMVEMVALPGARIVG